MIVPSVATKKFLEEATQTYSSQIEGTEALEYLETRGLTKKEVELFRIGFVSKPLTGHEFYLGRISFPYLTPTGVVSLRFRRLGDDPNQKKMLSVSGDKGRLYNTRALLGNDSVLICEGEIDTITAVMCGYAAVGVPGATSWNASFVPAFRYRSVKVVAHNDDDGAGLDFAKTVASQLEDSKIILCPRGMDLNKLYVSSGEGAVKELIGE